VQEKHASGRRRKPPNLLFRSLVALHISDIWWHWFWTGAEVGIRCGRFLCALQSALQLPCCVHDDRQHEPVQPAAQLTQP
jgi:hypothetical protein